MTNVDWHCSIFGMRVSKKTDYALRALFTLVDQCGRGPVPIRELSRRNDIPKKFLEQNMTVAKVILVCFGRAAFDIHVEAVREIVG